MGGIFTPYNDFARLTSGPIDIATLRGTQNAYTQAPQELPQEPSILDKARYALGHINEAMFEIDKIDRAMTGDSEDNGLDKAPDMNLDATLKMVSERAAILVGRLKTLHRRLGDVSDARTPPRAA